MEGIIISTLYPEENYHYMWRRVSPCRHGIADWKRMDSYQSCLLSSHNMMKLTLKRNLGNCQNEIEKQNLEA